MRARHAPRRAPRPPPLSDGPLDPSLLDALAILRRPPRPDELEAVTVDPQTPGVQEEYRTGTRVVRSHAGDRFVVRALSQVRIGDHDRPTFDRCQAEIGRELARLARRAPREVRRTALRLHAQVRREGRPPPGPLLRPGLGFTILERDRTFGTGGVFEPARFAARGLWVVFARHARRDGPARVFGVVPDGVVTITFSHPGRTTRVAAVRHDVVSLTLPWPPGDAVRARATWRGPDGLVVRRIGALL